MYKKLILITESLVVTCTLFLVTSLMTPSSLAASPQPQTPLLSIASIEDFELADPVNPLTMKSLGNGHATIEVDGQSVTAAFDASSGLFRVTYSDGDEVLLPPPPGFSPTSIEPISTAQLVSLKDTATPSPLILPNDDAPPPTDARRIEFDLVVLVRNLGGDSRSSRRLVGCSGYGARRRCGRCRSRGLHLCVRLRRPHGVGQHEVLDDREPKSAQEPELRTWQRRRIARRFGLAVSLTVFAASFLVWLFGPDEGRVHVLSRSLAVVSSAVVVAELLSFRIIARYGVDGRDDAVFTAFQAPLRD